MSNNSDPFKLRFKSSFYLVILRKKALKVHFEITKMHPFSKFSGFPKKLSAEYVKALNFSLSFSTESLYFKAK